MAASQQSCPRLPAGIDAVSNFTALVLVLNRVFSHSHPKTDSCIMAKDHPFQMLFETLGRVPLAHAESVNREAKEQLVDLLSVPLDREGRCILLRAPRAGHGKTHMLSRVQYQFRASHEFIPLRASRGYQIDASTTLEDVLSCFLEIVPEGGGRTRLDELTRRIFSAALQPLVISGEVPCQDKDGALTALRERPVETFDFHDPSAVTAQWTKENFEVLGERLGLELAKECGVPIRQVAFWVESLFAYASAPADHPNRYRDLMEAVDVAESGEALAMSRLEALLGVVALLRRVVLVADELEGFSSDNHAALRLATFIGSVRQSVAKVDVIISLNQDVWNGVFVPCLSDGLADRLSENLVELQPLTQEQMIALLESRVPGMGERVLAKLNREAAGTHARGLIRQAGLVWQQTMKQPLPQAVPDQNPAREAETPKEVPKEVAVKAPEASPVVPQAVEIEPADDYGFVDEKKPLAAADSKSAASESKEAVEKSEATENKRDVSDEERMEELLRQFRDRFGQSGL